MALAGRRGRRRSRRGRIPISGIHAIGHADEEAFLSTMSGRRTRCCWQPVRVARALVTNGEWLEFMAEGGYATPSAVAVRRLGRCRGARLAGARLLAQTGRRLVLDDARRPARGRSGAAGLPRQLSTKPTRFARWAGKHLPSEDGMGSRRAGGPRSTTPSARSGNGRAAPIRLIPAIRPSPVRSANTTANS